MLGPLLGLQWLLLLVFALRTQHNGWLYHQDADATYYTTTSWLLSDWHISTTPIGYGWPYLLSPISLFAGPDALSALPAVVVIEAVVLVPVATLCVYGIASRIGGRLVGYWTTGLWVVAPYILIPLWDQRYDRTYRELFLPGPLGLTALPELPSTVCLLLAAYLVLRSLGETGDPRVAAVAGLAAGFAVAIKPSNGIFLAAPLAALLLARRWPAVLAFAAAVLPALLAIAIWKHRGVGDLPPLAADGAWALPTASIGDSITRYVDLDVQWSMLSRNLDGLREFLGAVRFLEYLPIAGAIAIALRSLPKAALVALWFAAFFFIKGAAPDAHVDDGSFLRALEPAFPAYLILVGAIPLLLPRLGSRLVERFPSAPAGSPRWSRILVPALVVFAAIPLAVVLGVLRDRGPRALRYPDERSLAPIEPGFAPSVRRAGGRELIAWPAQGGGSASTFYFVFRQRGDRDYACGASPAPLECRLTAALLGKTSQREWRDAPPPGVWTYRVGVAANYEARGDLGGLLVLGKPVTVRVPG